MGARFLFSFLAPNRQAEVGHSILKRHNLKRSLGSFIIEEEVEPVKDTKSSPECGGMNRTVRRTKQAELAS
jgi:hypothetical protein